MIKNKYFILYMDLDGVLCDFESGFKITSGGLSSDYVKSKYGEKVMRNQYISAGPQFWANLNWIEGGRELWNASVELFENTNILSSMGTTDTKKGQQVAIGKKQWISKNIPGFPMERVFVVPGSHMKKIYVDRNRILVDDLTETISEWSRLGGIGIHHNHQFYQKTIQTLKYLAQPPSGLFEIAKDIYNRE